MTNRERATMERIIIDMKSDAIYTGAFNVRMNHYVRTLRAFLDRDYKFLRDHGYRLTPWQEHLRSSGTTMG